MWLIFTELSEYPLVVEIPTQSELDVGGCDGVVGCPEVTAIGLVEMVIHHVETGAFEVEVDVGTKNRVVTYLHAVVLVLIGELVDARRVVRRIVTGEVIQPTSKLSVKHFGDSELQVKVGEQ